MIDRTSTFLAILTRIGEAKLANATALGLPWHLAEMGVGDANGNDPVPDRLQEALIHEQRRAPLNQVRNDPNNPGLLITEQVIPSDVGGWWIRELGLYDADGDLVAVANCAPSYKPLLEQGSGRTQVVRMTFIISSTAEVVLKIDPSVVLATYEFVERRISEELNKLDFKNSVRVASLAPIESRGLPVIQDIKLSEGDRVLLPMQADRRESGIYMASAGAWKRSVDADQSIEVTPGLFVHVEEGTDVANTLWQLVTDAPITLGTTELEFRQLGQGNEVIAGTYRSVAIDVQGRVIAGTNPTTLASYAIEPASQEEAEAVENNDHSKPMTALRVFQAIKRIGQQVNQAAEDRRGIAKLASQEQVDAGEDDETIVTPKKLRWGFQLLKARNGYLIFPAWLGGLILQWGTGPSPHWDFVPFTIAFPNELFALAGLPRGTSGGQRPEALSTVTETLDGFTCFIYNRDPVTGNNDSSGPVSWIAIGH